MSGPTSAALLANLSREQRALLFERLRKRRERAGEMPARIPRRPPELDPPPASFAQERLWLIDRLQPGLANYNVPLALRIEGAVSPAVLQAILGEVVRRHEALRTTFREEEGRPVQVIVPASAWVLPLVDLSELPAAARRERAERLAQAAADRPFDLARGPLLRATLLRLGPAEHALLLAMHHVVSDGWSMGVLVREITQLYGALVSGAPSSLPPLEIQYADFAVWQRGWLQGEVLARQLDYWRERLAGAPTSLDLPVDRPRPAARSHTGSRFRVPFAPGFQSRLALLARQHEATPFMVLLAGFQTLLARLTGAADLTVGTPIANRNRAETEPLIGFFVNTLVLRGDLAGDPSFGELLARVRESTLEAYTHQDLPFEQVVEALKPERHLALNPLFQVLFAVQNAPMGAVDLPGLSLSPLRFEPKGSLFDLDLSFWEFGDRLEAEITYSTELFDPATIRRLAVHLETLLRGLMASPEQPVSQAPLLSPGERHQVAAEWSEAAPLDLAGATIPGLVAAQAARTPDAVAVVCGEEELTYAGLVRRAAQVADRLLRLGLAPESRVAVAAERSLDLIPTLLGILQAGCAYLPVDSELPEERRRFLLEDSGAVFLEDLPGVSGVPFSADPPLELPEISADQLACVIYTSGSTGTPKGVGVTHGNVARLAAGADYAPLGPGETLLQVGNVAFDISAFEIWGPLANGGRVAVFPGRRPSLDELARAIARHEATTLWLTAGLFHQMVQERLEGLRPLRRLLAGGDVLAPASVRRALQGLPGCALVDGYGPTENTTFTTCHVMTAADLADERLAVTVPVGKPIRGTSVHVLDGDLRPVAIGVWGGLFAGGAGVARGYLGRPAMTAERFVPDPFAATPGARLYRTGDLVRWRPDGVLEFLGRRDGQVKIRGFRIELGEIEAALGRHPKVRGAVVVPWEVAGDRRLAAYVVPDPADPADPADSAKLRQYLAASLPEPMIPAAFVFLDALPLTPNGKVDRRALPAPEAAAGPTREYLAPSGPVEESLAAASAELLGVERVGMRDNFFDLGGHSLLATRLVSRLRQDLGVELPLRVVFETPTLAALAALLEREIAREGIAARAPVPPPRPVPRDRPLPLSFAQERLWFLYLLAPASPVYNMIAAMRLAGRLDVAALATALAEVLRRHEALRTTFRTTATGAVQEVRPWAPQPQPVIDLAALAGEARRRESRRIVEEEKARPFDLERGPLLRTLLLRLDAEDHLALWGTHHIAADGWSLSEVFFPELTRLYAAAAGHRPSPLPEPPVQYADYAVWQRDWLRGEVLADQLGYWAGQLPGLAPLELPADRPRPATPSGRGGTVPWKLAPARTAALSRLARGGDATLFMALFAAFAATLHRETGAIELPVGLPVANRSRAEIEGLIGFFVNTVVLRGDLGADPVFPELLARSRATVLGALSHQDIPFERLVDELGLPRNPHRPPLLRVVFQLLTAPGQAGLELPGITLHPFEAGAEAAKFDLVVNLFEVAGGVAGSFLYDADLFDGATVARLAGHFGTLLDAWIEAPERPVSQAPLLSAAERHQLLHEWNPGPAPAAGPVCLHRRFEARVDRTPEAVALSVPGEGGERLTYAELDGWANRIARHLQASGVRPGDRIALLLERSAGMIAAILGVLKTGAAYVPIDPTYPAERIAFLREDSGASLLLAAADLEAAGVQDCERLEIPADPALPAYVIYTSGSTGTPKGVVVTHANVDRLFTATDRWFGFGAEDVWTLFHSYAFDFSVWEIWGALLHGGRLVVVPYWVSRSPEAFHELLGSERVTVLNQTPSAFRQLVWAAEGKPADLALRWVIFGGEALEPASLAPWLSRYGYQRPRLINMYGITETTVHVTYRPVGEGDLAGGSPIGQPIPDLAVHLLDPALQPVPVGVSGEIHVGGAGLAQGYLGRPDLTAERFVPDPFSGLPGARLYRSGDLARRRPDGDLEYLGRADQQVKIRGFRIELGEIEAALAALPGVREAVVLARSDGSDRSVRLVAYIAAEAADPAALRQALGGRLPDYMVPAAFVFLDALPLTPNGKVDRRALPAPEAAAPSARERREPRDLLERFLATQLAEVLALPAGRGIGIDEDFFELGGTSITSAIFVHRLQEALGETVHVVTIFDHPTVASLADYVRERHPGASWEEGGATVQTRALERDVLVPLQTGSPAHRPLFFVHSVGGEVVAYRELIRRLGSDLPAWGLQSPDPPPETIPAMAERYLAAVRSVQPAGPYRIAGWSMGAAVVYEMARQLELQGEAADLVGLIDASSPLRSAAMPRLRDVEMLGFFALSLADLHDVQIEGLELPPELRLATLGLAEVDLSGLDLDAALDMTLDLGRQAGLLPPGLERSELRRLFERFRANRNALSGYAPPPYGGELHLFRAVDQITGDTDPTLGWDALAPGRVRIFDSPGDHYRILREEVGALAGYFRELLADDPAPPPAPGGDGGGGSAAERLAGLSREQRALLFEQIRRRKEQSGGASDRIPRRPPGFGPVPASFSQERLWFLDRMDPGNPAFNMGSALRLRGRVEAGILERTLNEVVRRHESLRTSFVEVDGRPMQRIAPRLDVPLPVLDLSALSAGAREPEAARITRSSLAAPFDLETGPLVRATLLRLAPDHHLFLLDFHHVVSDGWSTGVMSRELITLYAALAAGEPSPLPPLPIQYADFALWQRERLRGEVLEAQLAYWRGKLGGLLEPLDLPTDRPRPAVQTFRGGYLLLRIPERVGEGLRRMAREERASLFMVLLAAFQVVLSRLSGQDDVMVGTPLAGRQRSETEDLIGLFLNTLALRTGLGGDPTFRELLGRVRETTLGAYAHQDVPFETLLAELKPERDLSRTPVFQVLFNMLSFPTAGGSLAGLEVEPGPETDPDSKFDLTLYIAEAAGEVYMDLVYNADLFDAPHMEELLRQYQAVMAAAAEDPERRIGALSLVTPEARGVLPDPSRPLPVEWPGAVHQRFLDRARRHPGRPVAAGAGGAWTWGDLDAASGRLAARLGAAGVGPAAPVAVWAHRDVPLAAALLGVLRAGAAFAILDPAYPPARLADVAGRVRPRAWVEVPGAPPLPAPVAAALAGVPRFLVDGPGLPVDTDAPCAEVHPDAPAWIAFTSGSTGEPKGIVGSHRPLSHFLAWYEEAFGLGKGDRFSLLSGLAHDPLLRDLFTPLWVGGELRAPDPGPDPGKIGEPGWLAGWLESEGITVAHLTPAMARLLELGETGKPIRSLRLIGSGGEALTGDGVARLRRIAPEALLVNFYGATETPQAMGWKLVRGEAARVPLGRGIDGVDLLVLARSGEPAGVGELGEIGVRTPYLALGYLDDPAGTAERFVPAASGRLYRTGDLGRYLPNGEVEYAGRADRQVKIRGFRVEPAEVERALGSLEEVRAAAVAAREDGGDPHLVAYVVPAPNAAPGLAARLRPLLAARLPDFMVPAFFVELPALPLTPNGKLDRRALPAPGPPGESAAAAFEAPRGPVEERLAGLWAELLRQEGIGAHDDFFTLGGHSLLATQLISRLRGAFQVELPLRAVFETPTIAGLAARIEREIESRRGTSSAGSAAPPVLPVPRDRPLPLSFSQERLWFLQLLAPESAVYNLGAAVRLSGRLDAAALAAALAEIRRRHEALRTTFRATAAGAVQEIHPPAPLPQPVIDLAAVPAKARASEARRIAGAEAGRPFDLARGPLLRALLVRLAPEEHVALWFTHHVTADGWSLTEVFIPELGRLYTAFAQGLPSPLAEPPVQYADYAVWQRDWLRGEALAEQIAYWRLQLAGLSPLELPADRPRPPAPSGRGGAVAWELAPAPAAALSRLARGGDATLFMALFAAFAATLHRETGAVELPVGLPVANRSRAEIEGSIGFFINTLVLRGDLTGDPGFPALLARARDTVLGALAHQDVPFERLVDELGLPRDPYRPPLLRAVFQLQTSVAGGTLELPGLTLAPFEAGTEAAKFDLVVHLFAAGGGVAGAFRYDADLFDRSTVARLAGHFTTLLEGWIDAPDRRLSELPLLTAAERHQLLHEWNPAPAPAGEPVCLHRRFEAQVDRAPQATALTIPGEGGESLTYGELDARANRIARHLQASGVRPGDRVALLLERSAEMVAAILGVLKAGAAYVPIDPAYPAERIDFTLRDSGAALLLTAADLAPEAVGRHGAGRPRIAVDPELPAYVIYTSGSTGRPKGVIVSHANADRLFTVTDPWFGFGADDVWTLFHSYAFDFSVWEIWGALLYGGRLVVVPYWVSRSPEDFHELLRAERVTVLNQTPSAFRQLIWAAEGKPADLALRWVIFGGEALEPASLAPWFARHGDERPRLINMYGITETTVHVTWRPVGEADLAGGSLLGQPIPDLAVHLLDRELQPVPIGVSGEIHVGGAGLAHGYLGRPDLTAERFIPDSFSGRPGARLYRSGDLARRLPQGDLEYLGRADQQVKIRGFRIELGEIEAALAAVAGVREAVVLARSDGSDRSVRLVAYVAGESLDAAALRHVLGERLPDYMIPSAFVFLDALPLTGNGKIDRAALPAPEAPAASAAGQGAPRDAVEQLLAGQFRETLGLPADREIEIDEDFFALGGNSITSAIFTHRLQEALGETFHVVAIFDHPTVSSLAAYVRESHPEAARRLAAGGGPAVLEGRGVLVPIQEGAPGRRPLFCVHSVGGEVVAYRDMARYLGPAQPVWGLQSPEPPLERVEEMAEVYLAALREVQPEGPYRLAGWSMGGIVAYEMARQLEERGETTEVLAIVDAASPLSWYGEPPRSDTEMLALFATAMVVLHEIDIPADLGLSPGLGLPPGFDLASVDLAGLDLDTALDIALDLGCQTGLLPPGLEREELRRLFDRFRVNRVSLSTYRPLPYGGEIHLFRAADQAGRGEDPTLGWNALAPGHVRIFDSPGDHQTILRGEVAALANQLRGLLGE